ncbi:MAG TPA: dephospho-CoA kinase [Casimicrobiaceae bacterium]|nr:dephospho-CoA kinase [Casimicrobiaceae bacterium]
MAYVVGLTGGIGSGKSAVAEAFAALGVEIVDTDALAHRLSEPGQPGLAAIRRAFGDGLLTSTGALDRAALRRDVFADPAARKRLEAILHPLIRAEAEAAISAWHGAYGIVVVPLLLETRGLSSIIDRVLVIDCPEDEQVRRVVARSGLAPEEVGAIMATQLGRAQRLAGADDVLDNSGALSGIGPQVRSLDRRYRELAAARVRG